MDNPTGISDEQLAYLNANLDLVDEYVHTQRLPYTPQCIRYNYSVVIRDRHSDIWVTAKQIGHKYDEYYYCIWRELLQFIEDHNSTPPILK